MSVATNCAIQLSLGDIKAEEESYFGELVAIREDKSQGDAFEIVEDVRIGREKSSDIRVNLKTVSRSHAVIIIDVNGRASLTNLSTTNPTILNGVALEGKECSTLLEHGDIFTIGERDFMYRNENLLHEQQLSNNKHIPTLETIGEENSQNVSLSRNNSMSIVGTPGSAIKSPGKPKSSSRKDQPKLSPKEVLRRLKTPIKQAILDRRISLGTDHEHEAPVSEEPDKENEAVDKAMDPEEMPKRVLKTPIRQAIQARRKSLGVAQSKDDEAPLKKLKTPLREAIHARRKSLEATAIDINQNTAVVEKKEHQDWTSPAHPRTLKTPLKEAIHARRKSISALRSAAKAVKQEQQQQQLKLSECTDLMVVNMPPSRRVSLACATSPNLSVEDVQMNISVNEDRRVSAAGTEYATWDMDVSQNMSMASTATSASKSVSERMDESTLSGDALENLVEASTMKIAIDAMAVEFERNGDANSAASAYALAEEVFMLHPELFSEKFCSEEHKEDKYPQCPMVEQYSQEETSLASSSAVKDKNDKKSFPSHALSLLESLQERGEKNVLGLDLDELDKDSSNLISHLTDNEMYLIDNYALMLEESGRIDTDEAYATVLDAYLRGLQAARKTSPFSPMHDKIVSPFSPIAKTMSLEENSERLPTKSVIEVETKCVEAGQSTPSENTSPRQFSSPLRNSDMELVDKYMYMVMSEAHVNEGVAYGISLDAYLADKVSFRAHVSHLLASAALSAHELPHSGTPLSALKIAALSSPASMKPSTVKANKKKRSLAVSFVGDAIASVLDDALADEEALNTPKSTRKKCISTGRKKLQMRIATPHGKVGAPGDFDAIMDNIASAVKRMVLTDDEDVADVVASAKKAIPIANSASKSASKSDMHRKAVAISLVGDVVQSALSCIATNSDDVDELSPKNVYIPASVSKSSQNREAFTELVKSLASAVDQAVDVVDDEDDEQAEVLSVSRDMRLSTSPTPCKSATKSHIKRRNLATTCVGDAFQHALDSLIQSSTANGVSSPVANNDKTSPERIATNPNPNTKSARKEAIVSLVENLAIAVETAESAQIVPDIEDENEDMDRCLMSPRKPATPQQVKTTVEKRVKLVARRSTAKKTVASHSPAKSAVKASSTPRKTNKTSGTPISHLAGRDGGTGGTRMSFVKERN